jgi:hypothetical protein
MFDGIKDFAGKLASNVASADWWASELPSFIVFSALVGVLMWVIGTVRQNRYRERFEKWRLEIIDGGETSSQDLFWEEVERIRTSDFERWKMVKSVVSGVGNATLTTVHKAEQGEAWVRIDEPRRRVLIDLDLARETQHVVPRGGGQQM